MGGGTVGGTTPVTGGTVAASSASATSPVASSNIPPGSSCTAASRQLLELISRYGRLFNLLTYASFTRSHRPILTPAGMRRLVDRGLLTAQEREVLLRAELPATQRHNAVLMWIARSFLEGMRAGHFEGGPGFENQILEKLHVCRAQYGAIGDELSGRMPLAYAHIVQVLVDVVLWMYPVMAISSDMSPVLAVLGTGILTITYQGLFDLAKQFLDPYDNESFGKGEDPLVVDTLIAETNAGSVRWMHALSEYPISSQHIRDGELSQYMLPLRGYSVQELEQQELERLERERERQERWQKEEEERRIAEEKSRQLREAAEAMIPALYDSQEYNLDILDDKYTVQMESTSSLSPAWNTDETAYVSSSKLSTKRDTLDSPSTPRERLLSLEDRLPTITSASTKDGFSMDLGQGVSNIVTFLDDIAGGVPYGLIPPETAAAKQERKEGSSMEAVSSGMVGMTKAPNTAEVPNTETKSPLIDQEYEESPPTNGDSWVPTHGDWVPTNGDSKPTSLVNGNEGGQEETNGGAGNKTTTVLYRDVFEDDLYSDLPWFAAELDDGANQPNGGTPSEGEGDPKNGPTDGEIELDSMFETELNGSPAKQDEETGSNLGSDDTIEDWMIEESVMEQSEELSNASKCLSEEDDDVVLTDDFDYSPWQGLLSDAPSTWWNVDDSIGTSYDGMGLLWGSEWDDAAYWTNDGDAATGSERNRDMDTSENTWTESTLQTDDYMRMEEPERTMEEQYENHLAELLAAEQEEKVETEAILNAPAFADSLAGYEDDSAGKPSIVATVASVQNETESTSNSQPTTVDTTDTQVKQDSNIVDAASLSISPELVTDITIDATNATSPIAVAELGNTTSVLLNTTGLAEPLQESVESLSGDQGSSVPVQPPIDEAKGDPSSLVDSLPEESTASPTTPTTDEVPVPTTYSAEPSGTLITSEEYKEQLAKQLEAEKEEMEETEAIMNAPAFAISLEGYDYYGSDQPIQKPNQTTTQTEADDLAVLEMDVLDEADMPRKDDAPRANFNSTEPMDPSANNRTLVLTDGAAATENNVTAMEDDRHHVETSSSSDTSVESLPPPDVNENSDTVSSDQDGEP